MGSFLDPSAKGCSKTDCPLGGHISKLSAEDSLSILETARTNAFCLSQGDLVLHRVRLHDAGKKQLSEEALWTSVAIHKCCLE